MKICLTSVGINIDALLDPRFGRCGYFIIYNTETGEHKSIENVAVNEMHGAGIQAAQFIKDQGVETIITGNIGPNAYRVLSEAGITVLTGIEGSIKENLDSSEKGSLKAFEGPNVSGHFGSGMGRGKGGNMGKGRG